VVGVLTLPLIEKSSRRGTLRVEPRPLGSLADLLIEKGAQHERNCLQELEDDGEASTRCRTKSDETFLRWSNGSATDAGRSRRHLPDALVHEGIRGIADFLIRKEGVEVTARMNRSTPS